MLNKTFSLANQSQSQITGLWKGEKTQKEQTQEKKNQHNACSASTLKTKPFFELHIQRI